MMKIDNTLFFSPNFDFGSLNTNDSFLEAFRDRIEGFYLTPAKHLRDSSFAFACGLVCCAAIDFLARYSGVRGKDRISAWVGGNVPGFKDPDPAKRSRTLAARFENEFRNGLVHEGRIKNCGQFSFDSDLVAIQGRAMVINPGLLLDSIKTAFDAYYSMLRENDIALTSLANRLRSDFKEEICFAARNSG